MKNEKTIAISFLGNPYFDSRVTNLTKSFEELGYEVRAIGFEWTKPDWVTEKGKTTVYKISKKSSFIYYLKFISLLKLFLIRTKASIYFAEDIYTLPFVVFFAKIRRAKIIYDSRELYAFLGGLHDRTYVQKIIAWVESIFIKHVDYVLTTGEMDSQFLIERYGIDNCTLLRNLPLINESVKPVDLRTELGISSDKKILLYQGMLFDGRGIGLVLEVLKNLTDCVFVLLGDGVHKKKFEDLALEFGLSDRIFFVGNIPQDKLPSYTSAADIGLSLIENISKSYYLALPNKLFEYIMAGIPSIVTDLPQMKKIVEEYKIGLVVEEGNIKNIRDSIRSLIDQPELFNNLKMNCTKASKELNWQKEFDKVYKVIAQ